MFINGKEFLTVEEMAEKLGKKKPAVRQLLFNAGEKPVSKDALYAIESFKKIKDAPAWGWPKGKPRKVKEPEKPVRKPKK